MTKRDTTILVITFVAMLALLIGVAVSLLSGPPDPPIIAAVKDGDLDAVKEIVQQQGDAIYQTGPIGWMPIQWAILEGNVEMVTYFFDQGFPVDGIGATDGRAGANSPLCTALTRDPKVTPAVFEAILERGADPNVLFGKEPDTYRALELCVQNNMPDKMAVLMRYGADPYLADSEGKSAMDAVQYLLSLARDPDFRLPDAPYGPEERKRSIQEYEAMVAIMKGE